MVWRAERALMQKSGAGSECTSDTVNFGGLDGLFESEGWQDAGEALGEHRLARPRGANH